MKKLKFISLIFCILIQSFTIGQETGGFCNQLFRMAEHCARQEHNSRSSSLTSYRGRVGKSGPRGQQGPPGIVNYKAINATIGKQITDLERYVNTKFSQINTKATQNKADIQLVKTGLQNLRAKIDDIEELMTWHKMFNNRYYKVYHDKVNYQTARSNCRQKGGDLVSAGIRNPAIRSQLMPLIKTAAYAMWIGLDDITIENKFVWVDGVTLSSTSLWFKGQPDNYYGGQDCASLKPTMNWLLDDSACWNLRKYMCERGA